MSNPFENDIYGAASAYGADPGVLTEMARLESSFNPGAVNNWDSNAKRGTPSAGLFQFIQPTYNAYARQAQQANPAAWKGVNNNWKDPRAQALTAAWAIKNGKGSAWATYQRALGKKGKAAPRQGNLSLASQPGAGPSLQGQADPVVDAILARRQAKKSGQNVSLASTLSREFSKEQPAAPSQPGQPQGLISGQPGRAQGGAAGVIANATREVGTLADKAMKYIRAAGGTGNEPWCGDFVQYVFQKSGLKPPPARSVPALLNWAKKNERYGVNAQVGNLAMFDWNHDGTPDHVGIVSGVGKGGKLTTIEGNTGGSSGRGVYTKQRSMSDILGFANPY